MKAAIAFALAAVLAGGAQAQSLPTALVLPNGSVLAVSVEETNTDVFLGQTRTVTGVIGYTEIVEADGGRLRMTRTLRDRSGAFAGDPADWIARAAKVTFWADARMSPQSIEDYQALVTGIFETGPLAGASEEDRADAGLSPSRRRLFERFSPEVAAQGLMPAQMLLAEPQGQALVLGKPQVQPGANGAPRTLTFTGVDAQGRAKVTLEARQEARIGPGGVMVVTVHCDYLIDQAMGLVLQATCVSDRDLTAPENMSRKTTARFVMSQALVTKP